MVASFWLYRGQHRFGRTPCEEIFAGARDMILGEQIATALGFVRGTWWILPARAAGPGWGRWLPRCRIASVRNLTIDFSIS